MCLYSTHCIACLYTICLYTPCKLPRAPIHSPYTPYELDINQLQLHKYCPCLTVVLGTPPRPQGGRESSGWVEGGVAVPADISDIYIYVYIYIYVCVRAYTELYLIVCVELFVFTLYTLPSTLPYTLPYTLPEGKQEDLCKNLWGPKGFDILLWTLTCWTHSNHCFESGHWVAGRGEVYWFSPVTRLPKTSRSPKTNMYIGIKT